jgi:cytochrome P450
MSAQLLDLTENFNISNPGMMDHPDRPFEVYDLLRRTCPVKRVENQGRVGGSDASGWLLTRYEDIWDVLRDDEHFSSVGIMGHSEDETIPTKDVRFDEIDAREMARMAQRIPMLLDPPGFVPYRRLMTPLLSPQKLIAREKDVRALVNSLIDDFIETGACNFHEHLNKPLPGILTCQLLGIPTERWRFFADPIDEFLHKEGANAFRTRSPSYEESPFARMQVPGMMGMLEIVEQRRREPKDDIISELANASIDGRPLNFYELGAMLSILLSGGTETTTSALGSAFIYLGRHKDLRERLCLNPAGIPAFVEEVLRMWPPLMSFWRKVKKSREVNGTMLEEGEMVYLALCSANRDPEEFENPQEFRADRTPNRHVTFTVGVHRCVGSTLARAELRLAIEEVLRRLPDYELDEAALQMNPNFASAYGYQQIPVIFSPGKREAAIAPGK